MHPPTTKFSTLSLGVLGQSPRRDPTGMAPVTRSHAPAEDATDALDARSEDAYDTEPTDDDDDSTDDNSTDDNSTDDNSTDDDDDDGPVRSPLTSLFYDIDGLDDDTQELVRELFRPPAPEETPPIVIEWCGLSNDPDVYAFQLQEIVPRTIRIGSAASRIPRPSCNCTGTEDRPCRHLVWLMDHIASQTLALDRDADRPLVLDPTTAFPRELGSVHARIADFHIGILAHALHCRAGPPNGRPDSHRVREAREILAALHGVQDDARVDAYAPEIFDLDKAALEAMLWGAQAQAHKAVEKTVATTDMASSSDDETSQDEHDDDDNDDDDEHDAMSVDTAPASQHASQHQRVRDLVERGDLQQTVLRLLVSNDEFFSMFLKLLAPQDKARDPFRKIQQRIESVLGALRAARTTGAPRQSAAGETISVAWAAKHVQSAVHQILNLLQESARARAHGRAREQHDALWARARAARAILWILTAIVSKHTRDAHAGATQDDRNLYQRLIGNRQLGGADGGDVLLDAVEAVHEEVQCLSQVETIQRRIQRNGYREAYMARLDDILARMRRIRDAGGATEKMPMSGSKRPHAPGSGSERRSKRLR